jgi:hypothetical protein
MCESIVKKCHLPTYYIACCSGLLVTKDIYTVSSNPGGIVAISLNRSLASGVGVTVEVP